MRFPAGKSFCFHSARKDAFAAAEARIAGMQYQVKLVDIAKEFSLEKIYLPENIDEILRPSVGRFTSRIAAGRVF